MNLRMSVLLCTLSVTSLLNGCDNPDPDDQFKSANELDLETVFIYDAEASEVDIEFRLTDAITNSPYRLTSFDGPFNVAWNTIDVELNRTGTGSLSETIALGGANTGRFDIVARLAASPFPETISLEISDLPTIMENSYQDTEIVQLFWDPPTGFQQANNYLEEHTVEVLLRNITCDSFQTTFNAAQASLTANSEYTSENTISTSVPYQSILEVVRNTSSDAIGNCELGISISTSLVFSSSIVELGSTASDASPNENYVYMRTAIGGFSNADGDSHTFVYRSESIPLPIQIMEN